MQRKSTREHHSHNAYDTVLALAFSFSLSFAFSLCFALTLAFAFLALAFSLVLSPLLSFLLSTKSVALRCTIWTQKFHNLATNLNASHGVGGVLSLAFPFWCYWRTLSHKKCFKWLWIFEYRESGGPVADCRSWACGMPDWAKHRLFSWTRQVWRIWRKGKATWELLAEQGMLVKSQAAILVIGTLWDQGIQWGLKCPGRMRCKVFAKFLHLKPTRASFTVTVSVTCHPVQGGITINWEESNPKKRVVPHHQPWIHSVEPHGGNSLRATNVLVTFFNSSCWFFSPVHDGWKSALKEESI